MEGKNERFPMATSSGGRHGMGKIPPAKWSKTKLVETVEEQDDLIQTLRDQARADARSRPRHKKINGPESLKSPVVRTKSHSAAAATSIVIFG